MEENNKNKEKAETLLKEKEISLFLECFKIVQGNRAIGESFASNLENTKILFEYLKSI